MSVVTSPLTRRAFLYRAAAVGGSALLLKSMNAWGMGIASKVTAPPPLTGSGKGIKVAVLGAGLAGLSAAYELRKLGYRVQVLEARPYAGGRCQTARRGFTLRELGGEEQQCRFDRGHYINHGPWRIPLDHQSTLHYAREFAVPLEVMVNENDHAWVYLEEGGPCRNGACAARRSRPTCAATSPNCWPSRSSRASSTFG